MNLRLAKRLLIPALLILAVSACDQGRKAPDKTTYRILNAAPGYATLTFVRETFGEPISLSFKTGAERSFDVDGYDFHIRYDPSDTTQPSLYLTSFFQELSAGTSYLTVLTGPAETVTPVLLAHPTPAAGATTAQVLALHAADGTPAVDLYLEPPGATIAAATPRASLAPGAALDATDLPTGDYVVTLTSEGNPNDVLLSSATVTLGAATTTAFVIASEAGETNTPLSVLAMQGNSVVVLYDANAASGVRVLNGAADGAPRDVAIDGQFSPPLFAAVPFAEATEFASVPSGDHTLNVTPPGNPGALELNQTITTTAPSYYTLIFGGEAGALTHVLVPDERRRVAGAAKLRFFNAASQFSSLDFLVAFENGDINLVFPQAVLGAPGASSSIVLQPGTYKFALRQSSTTNIVAEPQTLTVESGGLYGVLAINGPDTSTATMVLLDDF